MRLRSSRSLLSLRTCLLLIVAVAITAPALTARQAEQESADSHATTASGEAVEAAGQKHGGGHFEPVMPILMALIVILLGAKLGGELFERMGQPAVLGELIAGVLIGNVDCWAGESRRFSRDTSVSSGFAA